MPTMQVYVPDDLYEVLEEQDLCPSELLQKALRSFRRRQDLLDETDRYLAELIEEVGEPSDEAMARAEEISRSILDHFERCKAHEPTHP